MVSNPRHRSFSAQAVASVASWAVVLAEIKIKFKMAPHLMPVLPVIILELFNTLQRSKGRPHYMPRTIVWERKVLKPVIITLCLQLPWELLYHPRVYQFVALWIKVAFLMFFIPLCTTTLLQQGVSSIFPMFNTATFAFLLFLARSRH